MVTCLTCFYPQLKEFQPQDLALTLWAHGTLGYKDDHMFQLLCEACLAQSTFRDMKPVDVANIMTAFTRLQHHHKELVQRSLQVGHTSKLHPHITISQLNLQHVEAT